MQVAKVVPRTTCRQFQGLAESPTAYNFKFRHQKVFLLQVAFKYIGCGCLNSQ